MDPETRLPLAIPEKAPTDILYVIGSLDLGGTERHLAQLTPQLQKLGWRCSVYLLNRRGVLTTQLQEGGVEVIGPPFESAGRAFPIKLFGLLISCVKLLGIILRRRPRIAHFFLPMAYVIGGPLAIIARVPIRVMSRRSLNIYQRNHPILRRLERKLHKHMHALLGNSKAVIAELGSEAGDAQRVGLIYNGVELDPAAGPDRATNGGLTLIIVANLIQYKGHADLLRALASVADKLPAAWNLLCVGRDDGLAGRLAALVEELDLQGHVRFLGQRQDISSLLKAADVGLLCSHEEGFSNAILEGMAAGLPMIVTDVGGNAEAVVHGQTGFVVPPRDPALLGNAILTLASDDDLRLRMGQAGRQRVNDLFSLDRCVENYDKLYRALDSQQSSGAHA